MSAVHDPRTAHAVAACQGVSDERLSILLVDDDALILRSVSRDLRRAGHLVIEASCPSEARERRECVQVDVVVTDWDCGEGGGRQVLDECRAAGIPCVVHTGSELGDELLGEVVVAKPSTSTNVQAGIVAAIMIAAERSAR